MALAPYGHTRRTEHGRCRPGSSPGRPSGLVHDDLFELAVDIRLRPFGARLPEKAFRHRILTFTEVALTVRCTPEALHVASSGQPTGP